jgi:hypothetical protein
LGEAWWRTAARSQVVVQQLAKVQEEGTEDAQEDVEGSCRALFMDEDPLHIVPRT